MRRQKISLESASYAIQGHRRSWQPHNEKKGTAQKVPQGNTGKPGAGVLYEFPFDKPRDSVEDEEGPDENEWNGYEMIAHTLQTYHEGEIVHNCTGCHPPSDISLESTRPAPVY